MVTDELEGATHPQTSTMKLTVTLTLALAALSYALPSAAFCCAGGATVGWCLDSGIAKRSMRGFVDGETNKIMGRGTDFCCCIAPSVDDCNYYC